MPSVAISLVDNIANTSGTTVRARNIVKIFKRKYDVLLIMRASSIDDKMIASLNLKKSAIKLVRPERTKLWNLKLIPLVLHNRFHVLYCAADIFGFFTYYLLSKLLKYKIIFEAHALAHKEAKQISRLRSAIYFLLEVFIGKKADAIVCLSRVTCNFYSRLNKNTFFIPVFINTSVFSPNKSHRRGKKMKIIGIIGPFDTVQNKYQLDFLYSNLNRFDRRIKFKIVGRCRKRVRHNRLEYTGEISHNEYLHVLQQLDALLVPVKFATYGPKNKILEAMACGVPVVTTPKGATGLDFIKPNRDIFILEEIQLINKINKMIFDEEYVISVGLSARHTIAKYYNETIYADKLISLIRRFVNMKSARGITEG